MIHLEKTCVTTHQFLRSLDLKLPPKDEMLMAIQLKEHVTRIQELIIEHMERQGEPVFAEEVLINIGRNYISQKLFKEAIKCFLTNIVQYPESIRSWEGLAFAEALRGNISHALNYYSEVLLLEPSNCRIERTIATLSNQIIQGD